MAKTPRLPINHNKNGPEYHDASLDPEIIAEFVRRFPRLRFHSFQRNGIGGPQPSHMIRFIGDRIELIAAGVPLKGIKAAMKNGFAHVAGEWMLTRDDRRKPGLLEAQTWVMDGIPDDHLMAWLEPRKWDSIKRRRRFAHNVAWMFLDERPAVINRGIDTKERLPRNVVWLDLSVARQTDARRAGALPGATP